MVYGGIQRYFGFSEGRENKATTMERRMKNHGLMVLLKLRL